LNTNAIAQAAGVSIGTLYEFFPNKEAILVDMACRILRADEQYVRDVLEASDGRSNTESIRLLIRALLQLHRTEPEIRRIVMAVHAAAGLRSEHMQAVERLSALYARMRASAAGHAVPAARLFVTARAILGAIRSALEERSPLLQSPDFEDELVRLAVLTMEIAH
jgi:AcrR family transcriptional regulator